MRPWVGLLETAYVTCFWNLRAGCGQHQIERDIVKEPWIFGLFPRTNVTWNRQTWPMQMHVSIYSPQVASESSS